MTEGKMDYNLVEVKNLSKHYQVKNGLFGKSKAVVKAVDNVSFSISAGKTLGLVGESGCGKSTTGRTILRLTEKTDGDVFFEGTDIFSLSKNELRNLRTKMQIIFQDPFSSLSPRLPVSEIIGEAVREHKLRSSSELNGYIDEIMLSCGLQPFQKSRYPHEFSGGQRQRICIARALALNPRFVVCDEPVSALDVSVQAQIINLLMDLQHERALSYLFISHDLSVVKHICDDVAVMYLGCVVEQAPTDELFRNPLHPYTKALFSAIPIPDPSVRRERIPLSGMIPSPINAPSGCKFRTRCPYAQKICEEIPPPLCEASENHTVRCHFCGA